MTSECIDSVYQHTTGIDFEVILVDNASTDGSKDFFYGDKRIKYIYSEENLGFGKANNLGVKYASGRNVFFLNSDTLLMNNAIKLLSDYLDEHANCGICGGNLFNKDGEATYSYYRNYPSLFRYIFSSFANRLDKWKYGVNAYHNHTGKDMEVCQISGADLMIKRKVIDELGCFNPVFFMYNEDTELCFRIVRNGHKVVSVPDAKIQHLCGKSDKMGGADIWRVESRDNYFRLTGKTVLYRRFYAFYSLNHYRLLKFKYRNNEQASNVICECIQLCNHILKTI